MPCEALHHQETWVSSKCGIRGISDILFSSIILRLCCSIFSNLICSRRTFLSSMSSLFLCSNISFARSACKESTTCLANPEKALASSGVAIPSRMSYISAMRASRRPSVVLANVGLTITSRSCIVKPSLPVDQLSCNL